MPTRGDSTSNAPAYTLEAVTESDTDADPNGPFRGIMVLTAGTVKITTQGGDDVAFADGEIATGIIHPIRVTRVWSTGTTATVLGAV